MTRDQGASEEIKKLRSELSAVRTALVNIAPTEFSQLLIDYFDCRTYSQAYEWHERAAQKVLERVKPRPAADMGDHHTSGDRACCPLCGRGSDNVFGIEGFAYPEGLHRHLTGSYNARHCEVMKAALELAREHASNRS